ncbi:MAG: serine protease [candidate division Zixibacteria bacterium RBG_19FT_COMBO_42_43]|nr:MAG: serine protease [candidate division Zixibacteria bacterium RBG_19FT_COMBO_42_43]
MKKIGIYSFFFTLLLSSLLYTAEEGKHVNIITIDGVIGPVSSRIIVDAIKASVKDGAEALIIELNTPGGLDESMRIIIKEILNSDVPIIVYVSPSGSRAASAGVFITLAAHIAAMAPGTNIGAAHPVSLGGQIDSTMVEKITKDAVAYVKSIAAKRGRNIQWAEQSVRKSESIPEYEALKLKVIDLVVNSVRELLEKCDGKKVSLPVGEKVLNTKGTEIRTIKISWRDKLLAIIANPTIAYILLNLGMLGIFFELSNPGSILPGVVGAICLILAFFAFQSLPINLAGLLLILLALLLFILEVKVPSHGALTIGGVISMLIGSFMLINSPSPYMKISVLVILVTVLSVALFFIFAVGMGLKAQRKKPTTGDKGLIGEIGLTKSRIDPDGYVFIQGELWKAYSDAPIETGQKVKVIGVENLTLKVVKA